MFSNKCILFLCVFNNIILKIIFFFHQCNRNHFSSIGSNLYLPTHDPHWRHSIPPPLESRFVVLRCCTHLTFSTLFTPLAVRHQPRSSEHLVQTKCDTPSSPARMAFHTQTPKRIPHSVRFVNIAAQNLVKLNPTQRTQRKSAATFQHHRN